MCETRQECEGSEHGDFQEERDIVSGSGTVAAAPPSTHPSKVGSSDCSCRRSALFIENCDVGSAIPAEAWDMGLSLSEPQRQWLSDGAHREMNDLQALARLPPETSHWRSVRAHDQQVGVVFSHRYGWARPPRARCFSALALSRWARMIWEHPRRP